jgi:signal peptidase
MATTASLYDMAKRDLTIEGIRRFGEAQLRVTGTSMLPAVWPGDVIVVRRKRVTDLAVGQVALCYRNGSFLAHRVVARSPNAIITSGDSLPYDDPQFCDTEVLGEVTSILRNGKAVAMCPCRRQRIIFRIARCSELCTRILLRLYRPARASWTA